MKTEFPREEHFQTGVWEREGKVMDRFLVRLGCILCFCMVMLAPSRAKELLENIHSVQELARVKNELDDPVTEMAALGKLLRFASIFLDEGSVIFSSGNKEADELRRKAGCAVHQHRSLEAVNRALYSSDEVVRLWGAQAFEFGFEKRDPWKPLLPRLQELALHDPDASVRRISIQKLGYYEDGQTFLTGLRASSDEKDVLVSMQLLQFNGLEPAQCAAWYARAVKLLSDPDAAVRLQWLTEIWFLAWNPSTAPMYKVQADPTMVAALREITKAGSVKERELAGKALRALHAETERP